MNNAERRRIVQEAKLNGYQGSYVDLFKQHAQNPQSRQEPLFTAVTDDEKEQGLRPLHEAGRTDASMAFKDVPPNTPFNTVGMKAPIDIKKFDKQGHLVKSYDAVPPGIQSLNTGPNEGTVIETPARMQGGGFFDNVPYDKRGPRQEIVEPYFTGDDYNYRKALESGETPSPEDGHWGSVAGDGSNVVLKSKDHPTIKHEFIPTMMDPDWKMVGDPEGFFGEDNSMKYVPRMQEGDYVTPMRKKEFPSNAKRAKMVNYAKEIDMAGRLNKIGANTTNEELGRGSADRGTLPLAPNPVRPKELKRSQEGGPRAPKGDPTEEKPVLNTSMMENFMAEKKGGKPETWRAVADTIGYHESGPWGRMDPKAVQVPSKIGRGIFQFETTHSESFKTAKQRHKNVAKAIGVKSDPEILKATSADQLSREKQYLLFYGNLYESPAKLSEYASGELPLVDLWLQGHKRKETKNDRKSFEASRIDAKKNLSRYPSIGVKPAAVDATRSISPELQTAIDILKRDLKRDQ